MKLTILKAIIKAILFIFGFDRIIYNIRFRGGIDIDGTPTDKMICMNCDFDGGGIIGGRGK
jgi:hypothetical protein